MELLAVNNNIMDEAVVEDVSAANSFIEANTIQCTMEEIKMQHIIPVFVKDNETTISHPQFIDTVHKVSQDYFHGVRLLEPAIRVSHPIKGRIPEARNKAAKDLEEREKTLYYERMAFVIELPDISEVINGNKVSLVIGGVKAYNEDNLYNKKGVSEHFKVFIGFQNRVCLNLCIWTDGLRADIRATNCSDLAKAIYELIAGFQAEKQLEQMKEFGEMLITEHQFAQLIGKAKLYQYLPADSKKELLPFLFGDYQMSTVAKDYYSNQSFCRDAQGNINLWNFYNLFTGANKSSYIDRFLERGLSATQFISSLGHSIKTGNSFWFID
jgi:hypothetical protein